MGSTSGSRNIPEHSGIRLTSCSAWRLKCLRFRLTPKEVLVERFSFASEVAFAPRGDLLDRVTVAPLTPSIFEGSLFQAAIFRVEPGGRLRRHRATFPQILAVVEARLASG